MWTLQTTAVTVFDAQSCSWSAGDGIMSAIDMFFTVKVIKGKGGEKRVCLTMNGKFLAHNEQLTADNTA